jgi:hypothetical protein
MLGQAAAAELPWQVETRPAAESGMPPGGEPGQPWIEISRLGSTEIADERRVVLEEAIADLAGAVWNYDPEDEIVVLIKPLARGDWSVAAASRAEPGGLFNVSGLRFPDVGDYELIAGLFQSGDLPADSSVTEDRLRTRARASSSRIFVRVTAPPPSAPPEGAHALEVLTVGGQSVTPEQATPVPARGEIVLRGRDLPRGSEIYLALFAPDSDLGYLRGPARRSFEPDCYRLQAVSLQVPGDPRQTRLELIAVAATEPLAAGPIRLRFLERRGLLTSPTVDVVIDERSLSGNSHRVPFITITRIGAHVLTSGEPPADPLAVAPGARVEIGQYDRVPEGARVWVLTRPRGSQLWLAQGPALLQGAASPDDLGQGALQATWVWSNLLFEHPLILGELEGEDGAVRPSEAESEEFEVMAVLSTAALPSAWIGEAELGSVFPQTVSAIVIIAVSTAGSIPPIDLTLARIGSRDVDPETEIAVGSVERVEVALREALPPGLRVYVAWHPIDSPFWSLAEALPHGRSQVVPALAFDRDTEEGARYQLFALVTRGVLAADELRYNELLHAALVSSEVATVRYETAGLFGFLSRLAPTLPASGIPGRTVMSWIVLLLLAGLPLLAVFFIGRHAARKIDYDIVAGLARSAAERVDRALVRSRDWIPPPQQIDPASCLLGIVLLALMLYAIPRYLPIYAEALAEVAGLAPKKSAALALWLVLVTIFTGIFLELANRPGKDSEEGREKRLSWAALLLGFILLVLATLQGGLYLTFLEGKGSNENVPILGGIAFFLIAFVEATTFFYITKHLLPPAGTLLSLLLRLPFVLFALFLRFLAKLCEALHRKKEKAS